jgi:hypothetical protein
MRFTFAFVPIAFSLLLLPAKAQSLNWQEYRPESVGFRIDMPDKPSVRIMDGTQITEAAVAIGKDLAFPVTHQKAKERPRPELEAMLDATVKGMAEGGKLLSAQNETLGGYPARHFAYEDADHDTFDVRMVVTNKYFIQALFVGSKGNPAGKKFLDSLSITGP